MTHNDKELYNIHIGENPTPLATSLRSSMFSNRSVKMTSNYPTSCLEVWRKQKVNKPIFKGCPRKNICKYQHCNYIVFSCSACLQKEKCLSDNYAIIVRYAVYKAWSLHKGHLTLHDAIVSHHQNGQILTFKSWSCLQYYVHKSDRHDKKLQSKPVCKLLVFSKNQSVRTDSSEVIMTRHHA